jgi:hypothetical protein
LLVFQVQPRSEQRRFGLQSFRVTKKALIACDFSSLQRPIRVFELVEKRVVFGDVFLRVTVLKTRLFPVREEKKTEWNR